MVGADVEGAWIPGANLEGAYGLTEDKIKQTIGNAYTQLPDELKRSRPSHWNLPTDEQAEKLEGKSD